MNLHLEQYFPSNFEDGDTCIVLWKDGQINHGKVTIVSNGIYILDGHFMAISDKYGFSLPDMRLYKVVLS